MDVQSPIVEIKEGRPLSELVSGLQDWSRSPADKKLGVDPKSLTRDERLALVEYFFYEENYTKTKIAQTIGSATTTVKDYLQEIRLLNGMALLKDCRAERFAGDLVKWSQALTYKAIQGKEYSLAWRIQVELIEKLQDLGIVFKAPVALQVNTLAEVMKLANGYTPAPASAPVPTLK